MSGRAAVVYTQDYWCDIGPHVFPMEKFGRLRDRLVAERVIQAEEILVPDPATPEQLGLVHSSDYLDDLEHLRWTPRTMWSELPLEKGIVQAYILAAGGTLLAARESLPRRTAIHLGGGFDHAFADRAAVF